MAVIDFTKDDESNDVTPNPNMKPPAFETTKPPDNKISGSAYGNGLPPPSFSQNNPENSNFLAGPTSFTTAPSTLPGMAKFSKPVAVPYNNRLPNNLSNDDKPSFSNSTTEQHSINSNTLSSAVTVNTSIAPAPAKDTNDNPISNITIASQVLGLKLDFKYKDGRDKNSGKTAEFKGQKYFVQQGGSSFICVGSCGNNISCETLPFSNKKDAKYEAAKLLLEKVDRQYGDWRLLQQQKKAAKNNGGNSKFANNSGSFGGYNGPKMNNNNNFTAGTSQDRNSWNSGGGGKMQSNNRGNQRNNSAPYNKNQRGGWGGSGSVDRYGYGGGSSGPPPKASQNFSNHNNSWSSGGGSNTGHKNGGFGSFPGKSGQAAAPVTGGNNIGGWSSTNNNNQKPSWNSGPPTNTPKPSWSSAPQNFQNPSSNNQPQTGWNSSNSQNQNNQSSGGFSSWSSNKATSTNSWITKKSQPKQTGPTWQGGKLQQWGGNSNVNQNYQGW